MKELNRFPLVYAFTFFWYMNISYSYLTRNNIVYKTSNGNLRDGGELRIRLGILELFSRQINL
jgi:hypothetical protein